MSPLERLKWLAGVARHCHRGAEVRIAVTIAEAARDGQCWPGIDLMARRLGLCRASVISALASLEREGWVAIERTRGRPNRYRLVLALEDESTTLDPSTALDGSSAIDQTGLLEFTRPVYSTRPEQGKEQEKEQEKPARKKRRAVVAEGRNPWAQWIDLHRVRGLPDPAATGPDIKAGKRLGQLIPDEHQRAEIMLRYLEDRDPWVTKQGHSLRLLEGRINAYRKAVPTGFIAELAGVAEVAAADLLPGGRAAV